jgi:hypothetical protein
MPVTVRYRNGTAAVFPNVGHALMQAAHDRCWAGHVDPLFIADGDQSEAHSEWKMLPSGLLSSSHEVAVLHGPEDLLDIACNCLLCEWSCRTTGRNVHERSEIYQEMFGIDPSKINLPPTLHPATVPEGLPRLEGGSDPGPGYAITGTATALAASTAKSVIGVVAGSNVPPSFIELGVSGDATSGNLLIEIAHGTGATAGTATAFTPVQTRGPVGTPTSTSTINYTAEPTVLTITRRWRFPWPGGPFILQLPLGREPNAVITASTVGKFLGVRLTSTFAVTNSDWYLEIEE